MLYFLLFSYNSQLWDIIIDNIQKKKKSKQMHSEVYLWTKLYTKPYDTVQVWCLYYQQDSFEINTSPTSIK